MNKLLLLVSSPFCPLTVQHHSPCWHTMSSSSLIPGLGLEDGSSGHSLIRSSPGGAAWSGVSAGYHGIYTNVEPFAPCSVGSLCGPRSLAR